MKKILDDLKKSINNQTYYSALSLALSLPDICSQIEYKKGSNRNSYINWIDAHLNDYYFKVHIPGFEYIEFSGLICYALRCQFLHSTNTEIENSDVIKNFKKHNHSIGNYECKLLPPDSLIREDGTIDYWKYKIDKDNNLWISIDVKYLCNVLYKTIFDFYNNQIYKTDLDNATNNLLF